MAKTLIELKKQITAQDLNPKTGKAIATSKPSKKGTKSPLPAKYKDKATGKTWSGRGRAPDWFIKATEGGAKEDDLAT